MASNAGALKVTAPTIGAATVTLTSASGVVPVVYSDAALTTTTALPFTLPAGATGTVYLLSAGTYTLSVKVNGVEGANPHTGSTVTFDLSAGETAAFGYADIDASTASAWSAGVSNTYGVQPARTPVFAGDSITSMATSGTVGHFAVAGAAALGLSTVGQVGTATFAVDAGVGGNTSTQLLARFDTDVIARSPRFVHILIGTNDAGGSVPVATFAANIKAMVAKCRAIGARVVLGTVPPNGTGSPTNRKATIIAYNQWLCRYAIANQITVADYYRVLVDPATGSYLAAYDQGDGTHPSPAGTGAMAAELAAAVTRPLTSALLLTKDANDPWNYAQNALWLSSWATGWTQSGSPTGLTVSTTTGDANIQGNWGKFAAVASNATAEYSQTRTSTQGGTAFAVGNWHCWLSRVASTTLSSGQTYSLRARFVNVGTSDLKAALTHVVYTGAGGLVLSQEGVSPAATTAMQSDIQLSTGTGDLSVAQFTVYDLTAMGVTDTNGVLV